MNVYLYTISDDPRVLNKTLGTPTETTAEFIYPTDLYLPSVRLSASVFTPTVNYMYISDLGRYYFITDVQYENGGAVTLTARVDVLMSFAAEISSLVVNAVRQENTGLTNIVDNEITLKTNKELDYILFDYSPFNIRTEATGRNYVFVVAGGEQGA